MDSNTPDFKIVDHTADLGIVVHGKNLKMLFEAASKSMMSLMVKAKPAEKTEVIRLSVEGCDLADLMVRWLGDILYLFDGEHTLVTNVRVITISPSHLDAALEAVSFNPDLHEILCEIKAVTYHRLSVTQDDDGRWRATVLFDV